MRAISRISGLLLLLALGGCSTQELQKFNKDLKAFNESMAKAGPAGSANQAAGTPSLALAQQPEKQGTATQLIVPSDKSAADALDAALPTIKKVIGVHQCMKSHDAARLMNPYVVAGKENSVFT